MVRVGILIAILVVVSLAIAGRQQMLGAMTTTEIAQLQEAYYAKEGKYLQILEGGKLPEYEKGSLSQKLGMPVDAKYTVDTYESPNGRGYRIRWEDSNAVYSVGYGADAEKWTYTRIKEIIATEISTST